MPFAHGGNVYQIASHLGCSPDEILDYSASINPFGPPSGLAGELMEYFHRLQHYPDIANTALLGSLAEHHGLSESRIVVGNGSTELIYWLPHVLGIRSAVVVLPTFSEYRKAFERGRIRVHKVLATRELGFQPTVDPLEAVLEAARPEALLLTHPGSPSGTLLSAAVRDWVLEKGRQADGPFCIVDEVFVDFCEEESLKRFLAQTPKLILIRSMTKFYGIPGMRLGYLLASEEVAGRMRNALPPWSVNTLAQMAGVHCLRQTSYRERTLELVGAERERMQKRLGGLEGIRVLPGRANYLLLELGDSLPGAEVLQQDLLRSDRILVRDCATFEGLSNRYVRLAIRLPEQNDRLLEGITAWVTCNRRSTVSCCPLPNGAREAEDGSASPF